MPLAPFCRRFLFAIFLCVIFAGAPLRAAERPNILFVIADDWGRHAGAYSTPWIKTPGFDRVARNGLLFNNAFTPNAKCAPSRAILLTGRYSWQLEEAANHMCYFPAKFKTYVECLSNHGYFVGTTGKGWGPGIASDAAGKPRPMVGRVFSKRMTKPPAAAISNNDYAANFADFLDAATPDKPWCFWSGPTEPHRAFEPGAGIAKGGKKLSDIDHVPAYWPDNDTIRGDMLDYAFEIEHIDRHLVRMLDELQRRGQFEKTLIVVTSDHGMPFPRAKGQAYPDSNRVPLAICWGEGIKQSGRVIDDFVNFTDVAPTFLDVAGVATSDSGMSAMSGKSWREIFESTQSGQVVAARNHVLIGKERHDVGRPGDVGYPIRGLMQDGFLYLKNYEPDRWPACNPETGYLNTDGSPTKTFILEARRKDPTDPFWKLNFGKRPTEELYDLTHDPDCVKNLATDPALAQRREKMHEQMTAELKAQGDPRMFGQGSIFDRYPIATEGVRNFYERYMRGEKPQANWVNEGDFEKEKLQP